MATTKTRAAQTAGGSFEESPGFGAPDLDLLSDTELEALLFQEDEAPKSGLLNLPTLAGLSLVGVGVAYLFQQLGLWSGINMSELMAVLPVFAGVFIILLGMGVLSWRPKKRRPKKSAKRRVADALSGLTGSATNADANAAQASDKKKKKGLRKSARDKKLMGVCGGVAEYLRLDSTLVRIAFIIGLLATQGAFFLGYFAFAYVIPDADALSAEERMRIIRES